MRYQTILVLFVSALAIAAGKTLLGQTAPPASQAPPVVETPKGDWGDIDDRMVFLTTQLASVETSLAAVDKGLRVAGYQQLVNQDAADNARKGNDLMNRNMGMPATIGWEHFYGETADKFFYHPTDRNSTYHTQTLLTQKPASTGDPGGNGVLSPQQLPIQQRPPQIDYIYKANADAEQRAEAEVAKLGGQKDALLQRRSSLEAEQSALWCKIAFHAVASRELLIKPLYCFDLKTADSGDTADEHLEAMRASMDFLRIANKLTEEAEPAVDQNQPEFFQQLQAAVSSARRALDSKLIRQESIALDLGSTTTTIGKLSAVARRMDNISKNITDAYSLAIDGAKGGDDQRKNTFRAMLQEALVNFSEGVLAGDECVNKLAHDWKVLPEVGKPISAKDVTSVQQSTNAEGPPLDNMKVRNSDGEAHFPTVAVPAYAAAQSALDINPIGDDWHEDRENTRRVLLSACNSIIQYIPELHLPPILVSAKGGPISLYERGPSGEIQIKLATGGRFWAQEAYQMSHEFCHVACGLRRSRTHNQWFEECLCETASLFALREMANSWERRPPYPQWRVYAPALQSYAQDLLEKADPPDGLDFSSWYRGESRSLDADSLQMKKNTIVAKQLLPIFEAEPKRWDAIRHLNEGQETAGQSFEGYLAEWRAHCPEPQKSVVDQIATLFGIAGLQ